MEFLEAVAVVAIVVVVVLVALLGRRIVLLRGGGTIEMSFRLGGGRHGRGWALGVGRFLGDELQWFRTFSLGLKPKRVLRRADLAVTERRRPGASESLSLMTDSVVLHCESSRGPIELAMTEAALTGFQSWLEAAPPGESYRSFAAG